MKWTGLVGSPKLLGPGLVSLGDQSKQSISQLASGKFKLTGVLQKPAGLP